jgi:hypothetical protein
MAGVSSQGATLGYSGRILANVRVLSGTNQTASEIDVTDLGSSGAFKEFLAGFKDPGEVTIECHYDSTTSTHKEAVGGMKHLFNSGAEETFTYTLGDASAITFDAYVSGVDGPTSGVDEAHVITYTLRVTSVVTMPS